MKMVKKTKLMEMDSLLKDRVLESTVLR